MHSSKHREMGFCDNGKRPALEMTSCGELGIVDDQLTNGRDIEVQPVRGRPPHLRLGEYAGARPGLPRY